VDSLGRALRAVFRETPNCRPPAFFWRPACQHHASCRLPFRSPPSPLPRLLLAKASSRGSTLPWEGGPVSDGFCVRVCYIGQAPL